MTHPRIEELSVAAFTLGTDGSESDGTLEWDATTMVLVTARCGKHVGLGFSYTHLAAANIVENVLSDHVLGRNAMAVPSAWEAMVGAVRNFGRPGICSAAIASVDTALWDLKARILNVPLVELFGQVRPNIAIYGSGGFASYDENQLASQLRAWAESGIGMVKMKIGRRPAADPSRVRIAREAIGSDTQLFVDANGAYDRKQALAMGEMMSEIDVRWFEEPVSSDDLEGLRLLRDRLPSQMQVAAGEYGYDITYFRRMLEAGAVDVLQADVTRCAGYTEFLRVGALCDAHQVPLSAHTAPNLHAHVCCALPAARHVEFFHDHVRMEEALFDGVLQPHRGALEPDLRGAGNNLALRAEAAAHRVHQTTLRAGS